MERFAIPLFHWSSSINYRILIILDAKSNGGMMPRISSSTSFKNPYLNKHVFFRASLLINGDRSQKYASWVFWRTGPFSFTQRDFPRKWGILRDFWDPLITSFAVAANRETDFFQKFASAKLNLDSIASDFCLFKQKKNLIAEGEGALNWEISLSDQNAAARDNFGKAQQDWRISFSLLRE